MLTNENNVIAEYIASYSDEVQQRLQQIYACLSEIMPDAQQKISYGIPTFYQGRNIIHFAGFKNHAGLYPGSKAIVVFAAELSPYKTSKGAIQFNHSEELPLDLVRKIGLWCLEHNAK